MASFGAEGGGFPCACDMFSKLYGVHELAGVVIYSKQSGMKH